MFFLVPFYVDFPVSCLHFCKLFQKSAVCEEVSFFITAASEFSKVVILYILPTPDRPSTSRTFTMPVKKFDVFIKNKQQNFYSIKKSRDMMLSVAQHVYGASRLVSFIALLSVGIYFIYMFIKKRRLPTLYISVAVSMMAFFSIHVVIEYISFLLDLNLDASPLAYIAAIFTIMAVISWSRLLISINKKWSMAFYIVSVSTIFFVILIFFVNGQLVISTNELGYVSYSYSMPAVVIPLLNAIIALIICIALMKIGWTDRRTETGLSIFMFGLCSAMFTVTIMLWTLEIIHDLLGAILISIFSIILIIAEQPPNLLIKTWIKK